MTMQIYSGGGDLKAYLAQSMWCAATGVISSVGLHTDDEFKAFTPAEGYNKNVTYKNGKWIPFLF